MPRIAALLCIHNNADQLGWWMAHHLALGFSALLICDDHSTDGSRELLAQAARHYDIRTIETDPDEKDAPQRRDNSLTKLIQREHDHFDWMIVLAIDEYFHPAHATLSAFFAELEAQMGAEAFLQTSSIPINWCIMGLGAWRDQRLDGPTPHPRALFTNHAEEDFPDHRVTRILFRPTAESTLPNPFAHIGTAPDWSKARILHDAAASSHTPQARRYFDRNDHHFPDGQNHLLQSLKIAAQILQGLITHECYTLQNQDGANATSAKATQQPPLARFQLCRDDAILALHTKHHKIGFYNEEELRAESDLIPLRLIQILESPHKAWLYADEPAALPYLPITAPDTLYFTSLLDCVPLQLTPKETGVTLRLLPTGQQLLGDDTLSITLWPVPDPSMPDKIETALQHFLTYGMSAAGLQAAIRQSQWLAPSIIGAIYAHLPAQEARMLFSPIMHHLFHGEPRS